MTKPRTRDRLENWGRYWRDHGGDFGRCLSLEHRFASHRHLDSRIEAEAVQEQIASRPPAPEMRDALIVNEAWKRCRGDSKKLLKWSFCMGRLRDEEISSRCNITLAALPLRFAKAVREIERVLDTPNFADRIPLDNSCIRSVESRPVPTATSTAPGAVGARAKEPEQID